MDALLAEGGEASGSELVDQLAALPHELLVEAATGWESFKLLLGGTGTGRVALTVPLL